MPGWRSVSQFARATGAEIRKRLVSQLVEPASFRVSLDAVIEARCLEFFEPSTESRKLIRWQFSYGFLYVFNGRHGCQLFAAVGAASQSSTNEAYGGEGGIRTPDTVTRMPHFECGAFNRSATSPEPCGAGGVLAKGGGWDKRVRKDAPRMRRSRVRRTRPGCDAARSGASLIRGPALCASVADYARRRMRPWTPGLQRITSCCAAPGEQSIDRAATRIQA
jgi:hypothetical protein